MKVFKIIGFIIVTFVMYLVSTLIGGFLATALVGIKSNKYMLIAFLAALLITIIVYIVYYYLNGEKNFSDRFFLKKTSFKSILFSICIGFGTFVISVQIMRLLSQFQGTYKATEEFIGGMNNNIYGIIALVIIAPIFEELVFRGFLFGYLKKNCNIYIAAIIQALLFGLAHGNIIQGSYAFVLGLFLAFSLVQSKSLICPIVIHMTNNLIGGVITTQISGNVALGVIILIISIVLGSFGTIKMFELNDLRFYKR